MKISYQDALALTVKKIQKTVWVSARWSGDSESHVQTSLSDQTAFDLLGMDIANLIEEGQALDALQKAWLLGLLRRQVKRPARVRGAPKTPESDERVYSLVSDLVALGMTATRNDASLALSACDVVAETFSKLGQSPNTFEGVKKVWLRKKKSHANRKKTWTHNSEN